MSGISQDHFLPHILEPRIFNVADFDNVIAGPHVVVPGGLAGGDVTDQAPGVGGPDAKGDGGEQEGEDEVHHHAGRDDRHPFGDGLRHIAAWIEDKIFFDRLDRGVAAARFRLLVGFPHHFCLAPGIVILAQHFHIASQGDDPDPVFRFAPCLAPQGGRQRDGVLAPSQFERHVEPDEKLFAFDATQLGDQKVSQFVDKDHESQGQEGHGDIGPVRGTVPGRDQHQVHTQRKTSRRAQRSSWINCSRLGCASK